MVFFEKTSKIDKFLATLTKIKREKAHIKSETREIITGITEIQRILREYSELLYINKSDNLKEMDKILEQTTF